MMKKKTYLHAPKQITETQICLSSCINPENLYFVLNYLSMWAD